MSEKLDLKMFQCREIEVLPTERSSVFQTSRPVKGAFVNALITGRDLDDCKKQIQVALIEDGYKIISLGEFFEVTDFEESSEKYSAEYSENASDLIQKSGVLYSAFYCFEELE